MSVITAAPPLHERGSEPRALLARHRTTILRACAFSALAVFGAVRWAALITPAPTGRALALVAIALAVLLLGQPVAARSRPLSGVLVLVALFASLAVCGLPFTWIRHVRIARSVHAFDLGLSALPQLLIPYRGQNPWIHMTILAGAAVLLLDAAAMFAFGIPGRHRAQAGETGDLRRAVATVPLIALAAVPLTLLPPKLAYFQGLLLFALLAVAVWGERLVPGRRGPAAFTCALAVLAAMILAPDVRGSGPWINYRAISGSIGTGRTDAFDWSQTYGPLQWPQEGREVLEIRASHGDYWKAVDLDTFNGFAWQAGSPSGAPAAPGISHATRVRFTQRITVSIEGMSTTQIIGAGVSSQPLGSARIVGPGTSPGTWVAAAPLTAGDSYALLAYSPTPKARELAAAGTHYPAAIARDYLTVGIPSQVGRAGRIITVPPYGAGTVTDGDREPAALAGSPSGGGAVTDGKLERAILAGSPYTGVADIVRGLRQGARTPYDFVRRVLAYLGHGFTYDQHPPVSGFPLVDFLLATHRGYCQQFAGAMALMLRLGGVPARVAAGFTTGQYHKTHHSWLVSDLDAHAWVEAFFPGYGWVRFDPTPTSDPALRQTGVAPLLPVARKDKTSPGAVPKTANRHGLGDTSTSAAAGSPRHHSAGGGAGFPLPLAVLAVLILAGGALGVSPWRRPDVPPASSESDLLVRELERAFSRMGRPLDAGTTLASLEQRLRGVPDAAAYVAALGRARYTPELAGPPAAGRRAMRAYLRSGLGVFGAVRALWALPPWHRHRLARTRQESPDAALN